MKRNAWSTTSEDPLSKLQKEQKTIDKETVILTVANSEKELITIRYRMF